MNTIADIYTSSTVSSSTIISTYKSLIVLNFPFIFFSSSIDISILIRFVIFSPISFRFPFAVLCTQVLSSSSSFIVVSPCPYPHPSREESLSAVLSASVYIFILLGSLPMPSLSLSRSGVFRPFSLASTLCFAGMLPVLSSLVCG